MSSFTGVSVITDGKHCTTSPVDIATDTGYHLLVVNAYSRSVRKIHNGRSISSEPFLVGGHKWCIRYYPNGQDPSHADFVSLDLCLADDRAAVEVKFQFSFVSQVEEHKPKAIFAAAEACSFSGKDPSWGSMEFIKRDALELSTHLKADCFTVRCDIMVCDTAAMYSDIAQQFNNLLLNEVGADVTFKVSGEKFAAHRCVLAARSTVFMAQLFGPMKEGTTRSSAIQIKDMAPKVFRALLSFIYTDSFPEVEEEAAEHVTWLQHLFVAADRYDVQHLKFLCEKQLSGNIGVTSVASTLALAERHHCHRLKEACFKFIQVQSPKCLGKVMASDGWEDMIVTYPSVLNEFLAKLVSFNQKDKKKKNKK